MRRVQISFGALFVLYEAVLDNRISYLHMINLSTLHMKRLLYLNTIGVDFSSNEKT